MKWQLTGPKFPHPGIIVGLVSMAIVSLPACSRTLALTQSLRAAAEQGDANAQYDVGVMYARGQGNFPQDYAQAAQWIRASAEQGVAEAQAHLGVLYAMGAGVELDYEEAYAWIRVALAQGYDGPEALLRQLVRDMTSRQVERAEALAREYQDTYSTQ